MTQNSIHFEQIDVHRVMGIDRGKGFSLTELASGVNLIVGPNGSGKSTTARVIQELLWPGRTGLERPSVAGRFSDGDDSCHIEIDAGHSEVLRNGQPAPLPENGPPENRRRYYLSLYELIQDENSDFAKVIADKSQGGFDLEGAAKKLGFRDRVRSSRNENQALRALQAEVAEARDRQKGLQGEFTQLSRLEKEFTEARAAEVENDLLRIAVQFHEASHRCDRVRSNLEGIPNQVALLQGDERQRLDDLATAEQELLQSETAEHTRCKDSELILREVALGEGGVPGDALRNLKGWQQSLKDLESDIRREHQRLTETKSARDSTERRLGEHISVDQLKELDRVEVDGLSAFARNVHRLRGQKHALEEKRDALSSEIEENEQSLDGQRLRDGMTALSSWLASPTHSFGIKKGWKYAPTVMLAFTIACMSIFLALSYHWAWAFVLLLAVAAVGAGWWIGRGEPGSSTDNPRQTHQDNYLALGIEPPQAWEESSVRNQLYQLVELVVLHARREYLATQRKDLVPKFRTYKKELAELDKAHAELKTQLGLTITIDHEWLPLLVDNLVRWQGNSDALAATEEAIEQLEQQRKANLDDINQLLSEVGYEHVETAETAIQSINDLENRASQYQSAFRQKQDAQRRIEETIVPGLETVASQVAELLNILEIDSEQQFMIDEWLAFRPQYLALKEELSKEEVIRDDRRVALEGREELLESEIAEIREEIDGLQVKADNRDALTSRIAEINQQVEAAKSGFEVSTALEALDEARADLEQSRDENCQSIIGSVVADYVRKESVGRSRPEVFQRANELLVKFTRGTLQLELDDQSGTPSFQARSATGRSRPLNKLSSGERIQLLIAIRVAFLEYDERSRLPLLLDEALGTTDDNRIGVIIDSVIELARDDRQIFYFTAQQDEVAKWKIRMEKDGIPYKVIDLGTVRRIAAASTTPLEFTPVEFSVPVSPDGMSYEQYGETLEVPGLDPLQDNMDGIHLWHIFNDADSLHALLSKQITNWGQLQLLVDHGGKELVDLSDGKLDRAVAAAAAIEAAYSAWLVGCCKTVDRNVLSESDCVTEAFFDKVADIANSLGGDAQALLDALEAGDVPRWRSSSTESLTEYFEANGFITSQTRLSAGEIRIRVLARLAVRLKQGLITESFIERVVQLLPVNHR
jgi:DNA repair exonuclease SbcCD ATPase subunit